MGVLSRARSIKRSNTETPVVDNYETFLQRIAVTCEALDQQRKQLVRRFVFLHSQSRYELDCATTWNTRSESLREALSSYRGSVDGYKRLADLSAVADKLHSASEHRHESISLALAAIDERKKTVVESIEALKSSRTQLETSRKLGLAMESLTRAASTSHHIDVNSAASGTSANELREIKLLVAQAEALVELKEW